MIPILANAPARSARSLQPILREASFDDYEEIAGLQLRNGLSARSRSHWTSLWTDNPAFQKGAPLAVGWVLESPERRIVGYLGNLPLAYRFHGRHLCAATPHSWAVDSDYRRYSIWLLDRFLSQKNIDLLVFATVNPASEPVYRALGCSRAPSGAWDRSGFWVVRHYEFARAALRTYSPDMPQGFAVPVAAALAVGGLAGNRWHRSAPSVDFEFCSSFDSRFNRFWDELQRENGSRLLAVRDQATLEWHFGRSLRRRETWVLTACKDRRLVAYAVFSRWDHPKLKLKRLRLVDFQCLTGFDDLVRPMISRMLQLCRREGIAIAENVGRWLESSGRSGVRAPYQRKMKSWIFYYKTSNPELSAALTGPGVWQPTSFDGDASL